MPILMYKGINLSGSGMSASSSLDDASEKSVATTKITNELNKNKAPLESPEFTGTPVAPTANKGTSSRQIANTEYVQTEIDDKLSDKLNGVSFSVNNGVLNVTYDDGQ